MPSEGSRRNRGPWPRRARLKCAPYNKPVPTARRPGRPHPTPSSPTSASVGIRPGRDGSRARRRPSIGSRLEGPFVDHEHAGEHDRIDEKLAEVMIAARIEAKAPVTEFFPAAMIAGRMSDVDDRHQRVEPGNRSQGHALVVGEGDIPCERQGLGPSAACHDQMVAPLLAGATGRRGRARRVGHYGALVCRPGRSTAATVPASMATASARRPLQRTVRSQLVCTSRTCTPSSQPRESRSWQGT